MTFEPDEILKFSDNFNNKLNCTYFTTIRLASKKFQVGKIMGIELGRVMMNRPAQIVEIKHFYLRDLNEFMAGLDTGYSREEAIQMIRTMYRNIPNIDQCRFVFLLMRRLDQRLDQATQMSFDDFRKEMV